MYDRAFYEVSEGGMRVSAEALVPKILDWIEPNEVKTMIDVGCGRGWWAAQFAGLGIDVLGIDGGYVQDPVVPFRGLNLEKTFPYLGKFDLALCLEVAEHLSEDRAGRFVHDLCKLAPIVVFSAAIPGQGGTGHVNEQPPEYWAAKFRHEGFIVTGSYRERIWDDDRIENWYRQNLLIAYNEDEADCFYDWALPRGPIPHLVHPVLFDHVRGHR
jgi:SAM-dependent methyltransferase